MLGKSLFQPEYKIIKKAFEEKLHKEAIFKLFQIQNETSRLNVSSNEVVEEVAKNCAHNPANIECQFFETSADVPDPRELSSKKKNLMIFDDLQLEKRDKCKTYDMKGRHSNVDCFYFAQNYFKLPRQTIRENANFICLFPQDQKNVHHIYDDHVSTDMSKEDFKKLCKAACSQPHWYVVIDLTSYKDDGKYRLGLENSYIPD